jgi:ribosomal protein L11 methyltransferase
MPYRIDLPHPPDDAFDRLVELGALDVAPVGNEFAAIMPDRISVAAVSGALGVDDVRVTSALGRDDGSVWLLVPRPVQVGRLRIVPDGYPPQPDVLRLIDSTAFGTGLHPTTVLCLEAIEDELSDGIPASLLDVGTGSGILALAALHAGVATAVALDNAEDAVRITSANAAINAMASRLRVVHGGPEAVSGTWPLILANILTAPLIEMAPRLSRRVDRGGRLVLSGIRSSLADEVAHAYRHSGLRQVRSASRDGWTALTFHAPR